MILVTGATGAQDGRVAMVDARDVAAVAVSALTGGGHAGKTYTLTRPVALSFDDVAKTLSQPGGPAIAHPRVPAHSVRDAVRGAGAAPWLADDMSRLYALDYRLVGSSILTTYPSDDSSQAGVPAGPTKWPAPVALTGPR